MFLVVLISIILLVVTLLLAIADHLLIRYGQCKITVKEEETTRQFEIKGGVTLLTALTESNIDVRSPCGGKATCGYCKTRVTEGGGAFLPTEEALISREERLDSMRLACQVKVKNDIKIEIPEYFSVVRNIVKNKAFDENMRWAFLTGGVVKFPEMLDISRPKRDNEFLDDLVKEFKDSRGSIVPLLQRISKHYNYLPEPVLANLAGKIDMPLSKIFRIATFYDAFSLEPRGKIVVKICTGTACYVKGSGKLLEAAEKHLGIKVNDCTEDLTFGLETVNCIGCCGQAPAVVVNNEIYGYLKTDMIPGILDKYGKVQKK